MRLIDKAEWANDLVDEIYTNHGQHVAVGECDRECDMIILKIMASTDKVMQLIDRIGGEKEKSIVSTMRESNNPHSGTHENRGSRKRITDRQRSAIAIFLYERFQGHFDVPGAVITEAWGE